ncbi:hypothetical protein L227DRAFT_174373 [Lentinus tigrinus ALCF2SS1-6]|uniref:Uncharacterized protein n=1 Tax=Lentinus tigrinus ALCF2SS1-6 TaxID=1328759 RepID=A0A5C2SCM4_9APHY|nr:hypothetical protein L227DRAFT_174373 [Lentinus tigrinus ALCF2SS1-6]
MRSVSLRGQPNAVWPESLFANYIFSLILLCILSVCSRPLYMFIDVLHLHPANVWACEITDTAHGALASRKGVPGSLICEPKGSPVTINTWRDPQHSDRATSIYA